MFEHRHKRLEPKQQVAEQKACILHGIGHMLQHSYRRLDQLGLLDRDGQLRHLRLLCTILRLHVDIVLVVALRPAPQLPQVLAQPCELR